MKNLFLRKIAFYGILIPVILTGLVQACKESDVIDLYPDYDLDALTNPSSMDQVEQVLLGSYANFRNNNYYGSNSETGGGWALMPDVLSDNLYETADQSLANSRVMADWLFQPNTNQVTSMYTAPYQVIAGVNIVLRDIDKYTTAENQKKANRLKGQAYAIRALSHFDLFRYFAGAYDPSAGSLAIYYSKDFIASTNAKPARNANASFYEELFADISQAEQLLADVDEPINQADGPIRPYMDLTAVYALHARVCLYAGQYEQAEDYAARAIAERPLQPLDQAAFTGMFRQTNAGEIIWNVQFESGEGGPGGVAYSPSSKRNFFRPAFEIATADGAGGLIRQNDVRYAAYFTPGNGGLSVTKYIGKNGMEDGNANFIVFRTGEMYLIRAEARARLGKDTEALKDLNDLRKARITGYTDASGLQGDDLLDAIAQERRRELFGEGHRFFDLKRTVRTIERGVACGDPAVSSSGACSLAPTAREWSFPIPESVMRANEHMQQNPEWQ